MNSEKKGAAIGKALLSGPYLIWMAGFTLIPLAMILWYGLTDKGGGLTMANVIAIASADHAKALWLSLGPVSYTHLDVYKRQVCSVSPRQSFPL